MKVTIEIENDDELDKLSQLIQGKQITVLKAEHIQHNGIREVFNKYNIKLPDNYIFNRERLSH